jgi:hypothetical protein
MHEGFPTALKARCEKTAFFSLAKRPLPSSAAGGINSHHSSRVVVLGFFPSV